MPDQTRRPGAGDGGPPGEPPAVAGRRVTVEKRKWDGRVSARWEALLAAGPPGPWVWRVPAGTLRTHPATGRDERLPLAEVAVAGPGNWLLTVVLDGAGHALGAVADAILPVRSDAPGLVAFVDLDLDLEIDLGRRTARLRDEADLLRNAREMAYPGWLVDAARTGIEDVRGRLAGSRWPFASLDDLAGPTVGRMEEVER